ncbi:cyclase family protein [Guptibacillus sedimenti]|uniref:cyclase family protein n=1 Tax=Guptibacillus sedimenti TaxID=3025680 RepID=UPI00235E0284|nr:cyclase family protein [Pseudalkalibacillus sedimenti]
MNFKKVIDLSIPVNNQTPVYPGDPKPNIYPIAMHEKDGYQVTQVNMGTHTGTHLDAPFHFQKEGECVDESKLTKVMAPGHVIHVTRKNPGEVITLEEISQAIKSIAPGTIALFHTGWSKYIGTETYFNFPYLSVEIVNYLLEKGITTFFIDTFSIDAPGATSFPAHEAITSKNGIIGECFSNFDQIDFENPLIIALPLKLEGLDASPVRAIAVEVE